MHVSLSAALAILSLSLELTSALPVDGPNLMEREEPECAKIEDFTVKKFSEAMTSKPEKDKCLFYTRRTAPGVTVSLSETAQCYAEPEGLTTIWKHWPDHNSQPEKDYYAMRNTGWLRCINADPAQKQKYFENMSEAYSLACTGKMLVMTDDPKKLPTEGIWPDIEFPTLKSMDTTTDITAVDVDGNNPVKIWPTEGLDSEDTIEIYQIIGKRATCDTANKSEPEGEDWFG